MYFWYVNNAHNKLNNISINLFLWLIKVHNSSYFLNDKAIFYSYWFIHSTAYLLIFQDICILHNIIMKLKEDHNQLENYNQFVLINILNSGYIFLLKIYLWFPISDFHSVLLSTVSLDKFEIIIWLSFYQNNMNQINFPEWELFHHLNIFNDLKSLNKCFVTILYLF